MNNIEHRIEKLEKHTGDGKPERKTWVLVYGEPEPLGIAEGDLVVYVIDEETKDLMAHIGDRLKEGKPQ